MLVGDYDELKRELFEKFREIEEAIKSARQSEVGIPAPTSNEVRYAGFHYIKAEEELSNGHKEKATEEIQKAVRHTRRALSNVQKFRFLFYLKTARSVIAELKGYQDLASTYIKNYDEHSKNLFEIKKFEEDTKSDDDDSPKSNDIYEDKIKKLRAFLNDFEKGEMALLAAIDKRSVLRWSAVRILGVIVGAIVGVIVGWLICTLVVQS